MKSKFIVFDDPKDIPLFTPPLSAGNFEALQKWERSTCRSIDYPTFLDSKAVTLPDMLAEERPCFSGYVRYESHFDAKKDEQVLLEITDAAECTEVFVNEKNLGLQIVPPMLYDLSGSLSDGQNQLVIEVATTLERERSETVSNIFEKEMMGTVESGSGLTGTVRLYREKT